MGLLRLSWWQINWTYRWTRFLFFRALELQGLCLYFLPAGTCENFLGPAQPLRARLRSWHEQTRLVELA